MANKKIVTVWEVWQYDVWGNAKDGYEVNDRFCTNRHLELTLTPKTANEGTPLEFSYAEPSLAQIKNHLGITCNVSLGGDDTRITIDRSKDGKPVAEMICVSHESLSPVRSAK